MVLNTIQQSTPFISTSHYITMMDEDAEDNSRSTTDTKRCHHRMPSQHGSVEDVKDNNSFNRRYKTLPPYATHHHHGILATIHTKLIKQHYHWQERMLLYKHLLSTNKQSPHSSTTPYSAATNLHAFSQLHSQVQLHSPL
jgi:hypothetical protein